MDEKLEAWIAECVSKGTFENKADAIEFCVGATRAFCEKMGINQEHLKKEQARARAKGKKDHIYMNFPLKWSDDFDRSLREEDTGGAVHDAVSGAVRDQAWGMLGDPGFAFDPEGEPGDDIGALWADYLTARRYIEKLQRFSRRLMEEKSEVLQQRDELAAKMGLKKRKDGDEVFFEPLMESDIDRVQEKTDMPLRAIMELVKNSTEHLGSLKEEDIIVADCNENKADFKFKTPDGATVRYLVEKTLPEE